MTKSIKLKRDGYVFETTQLFPDIIDILEYLEIDLNLKQYEGNFMRHLCQVFRIAKW